MEVTIRFDQVPTLGVVLQEWRKDLTGHSDDSSFSFDPSKIVVKQLGRTRCKKVNSRKGLLLT